MNDIIIFFMNIIVKIKIYFSAFTETEWIWFGFFILLGISIIISGIVFSLTMLKDDNDPNIKCVKWIFGDDGIDYGYYD